MSILEAMKSVTMALGILTGSGLKICKATCTLFRVTAVVASIVSAPYVFVAVQVTRLFKTCLRVWHWIIVTADKILNHVIITAVISVLLGVIVYTLWFV
jgi:hypothetical protein